VIIHEIVSDNSLSKEGELLNMISIGELLIFWD